MFGHPSPPTGSEDGGDDAVQAAHVQVDALQCCLLNAVIEAKSLRTAVVIYEAECSSMGFLL